MDSIDPKQVDESAQLVDVRADHEWEAGRVRGAIHLPLAELSDRIDELDRGRPVVVYCRGGSRCEMAAEALAEAGFEVAPMAGGLPAWVDAGLAVEPEGGYVAESGEAAAILESRKRDQA